MTTLHLQPSKPILRAVRDAIQAKLRDQSGQSLLEMAFAVPVFLLLLFGFVGFAVILFDYENSNFACKQAARYASLHSSTSLSPCNSTQVAAIVSHFQMASPQSSNVSISWPSGNTIGETVIVSVNATYPIAIPFSSVSTVAIGASAQRTIMR